MESFSSATTVADIRRFCMSQISRLDLRKSFVGDLGRPPGVTPPGTCTARVQNVIPHHARPRGDADRVREHRERRRVRRRPAPRRPQPCGSLGPLGECPRSSLTALSLPLPSTASSSPWTTARSSPPSTSTSTASSTRAACEARACPTSRSPSSSTAGRRSRPAREPTARSCSSTFPQGFTSSTPSPSATPFPPSGSRFSPTARSRLSTRRTPTSSRAPIPFGSSPSPPPSTSSRGRRRPRWPCSRTRWC